MADTEPLLETEPEIAPPPSESSTSVAPPVKRVPTSDEPRHLYRSVVHHLATTLGVHVAFVARPIDEEFTRARTVALWMGGNFTDDVEYQLKPGPCGEVYRRQEERHFPESLQTLFPNDPLSSAIGADSYLGIPLFDPSGPLLGHLAILDLKAMDPALKHHPTVWDAAANLELELAQQFAMENLRHERDFVEAVLSSLSECIIAFDMDGRVTRANNAARELLNVSEGTTLPPPHDRPWKWTRPGGGTDVLGPEDTPLARARRGELVRNEELIFHPEGGAPRTLLASARPIYDSDETRLGAVAALRDITLWRQAEEERRQMERRLQERQKMESLGMLAGGIAHDFNNLLVAVMGHAGLAMLEVDDESQVHSYLKKIEASAQHAADLARQLLAYSGRGQFLTKRLNMSAVVDEMSDLLAVGLPKNVDLRCQLDNEAPVIEGDPTQLQQVVMNLVINAGEAIGTTGGAVKLSTRLVHVTPDYFEDAHHAPSQIESQYVCIEIQDDGQGMDTATLARIFDPFFSTKFTGRGLGLASVLGIVNGHNGALRVESVPGQGSTFRVFFPCAEGEAESVKYSEEEVRTYHGAGLVLVVDDESSVRQVTKRILVALGFKVELAANGLKAVEIFESRPDDFSLVLLDMTMPDMDGVEVFQRLRDIQPEIRVVLMSGYSEQEVTESFTGELAGFLHKPFRVSDLKSVVRDAIELPKGQMEKEE